jgi:hypothetical protein
VKERDRGKQRGRDWRATQRPRRGRQANPTPTPLTTTPPSPFPTNKTQAQAENQQKTQARFPHHHAVNHHATKLANPSPSKSIENPRHYGEQREESGERRARRGKEKEEREKIGKMRRKEKKNLNTRVGNSFLIF